jgi:hypothetical protein
VTAARTTRTAALLPAPRPTRALRWEVDLLAVPAGAGKTLVAGGMIRGGVFEWKIPTLPPVG